MQLPKVLCFGEVLWDCLPDDRHIGGAPLNVAYHLTQLGCEAWPVSCVGDDLLGSELLSQLDEWGVSDELLGVSNSRPTGHVKVTIDQGSPTFDIVEDVAWDYIDLPGNLPTSCQPVDAVVYGSLALRTSGNRDTLQRLFDAAPNALRVFDVNLRPPFDEHELVWTHARTAGLLKLNDEELALLLNQNFLSTDLETGARALQAQTNCERICITAGSTGAGLLNKGAWHWVDAVATQVRDTVGAGDSFLAALLQGYLLRPEQPQAALQMAATLASFVAGSDGATPSYAIDELL